MIFYQHKMKSGTSLSTPVYLLCTGVLLGLVSNGYGQHRSEEDISRTLYVPGKLPLSKSGWRPIVSSGALPGYNFGNAPNAQTPAVPKIMTGQPQKVETKGISPHLVGVSHLSGEYFGNGILSTSIRPLVTRDVNKLTSIAQTYKPVYQQSNINLNSPVNSYLNPFSLPSGTGLSHYKVTPGYQFDSNIFVRHPQTILNHRPSNYNKIPNQVMLGKRLKHNQLQAQMLQQLATNHYNQAALQSYQNSLKKPLDSFSRPLESFSRPNENFLKPNINSFQKHVNPQESLSAQIKIKAPFGQTVAAVTYKPPLGSHFQQFGGLKEESFGPIPSNILGSFTSFGHASIKARDPPFSGTKNGYLPTSPTKAPYVTTETFTASSTDNTNVEISPLDAKPSPSSKPLSINVGVNDEYTRNLVPPPQVSTYETSLFNEYPSLFNRTQDDRNLSKFNFIPSPVDPLSKLQNSQDNFKLQNTKIKQHENYIYNTNLPTKRPEISSFFDTTLSPSLTTDPFEPQSTNAVPGNLLAQVPPPYTTINTYTGQSVKSENTANKDKYQSFTSINHAGGPPPLKYAFDDVKYFPTRGQEYFETKFSKNKFELNTKEVPPYRGSYEVTETWGSSGETNTQPTLHSWLKPAQSFKQYNSILTKPKHPSFNVIPNHDDRIIPLPFFPTPMASKNPDVNKNPYSDVSTVYSTIAENNKNKNFFSQLENSLSSLADVETQSKRPIGDETYDLAAPIDVSYDEDVPKSTTTSSTTTQTYEEPKTTQQTVSRRKPSRYRTHHETSTAPTIDEDLNYTTRFEMFKQPTRETENDLHAGEMPTIPPSKHFRRPSATPPSLDNWEENVPKKRNKNRRRRPQIRTTSTTTTETAAEDLATTTDAPVRTYRYRTTTASPEIEETTKLIEERKRPKLRLSSIHKTRPTKASSLPDFTSSAQPTMLPTVPATLRPKLHSRIRITTMPPLDLEDLFETTTPRGIKIEANNDKQSSIMKIAKDIHSNRLPNIRVHSTSGYENFHETPDHTHKQDEKDTPTSDVAVNTHEHKYSAQKLQESFSVAKVETTTKDRAEEMQPNTAAETGFDPTSATFVEDNYSENNIQASQTTRSEQLFTELKSGNRGNTRKEEGTRMRNEEMAEDGDVQSTTPTTSTSKSHRLKVKPNKYDSNRPRFSVKDYRNRLSQYSSTSSTEKPVTSESSNRLRFPNRSRFPSFKGQNGDSILSEILGTTTELPRKKFTPKDPRHRGSVVNDDFDHDEKFEASTASGIKIPPPTDNEVVTKPVTRLRGGNRRDPNRLRSTTTTPVTPLEVKEKSPQKLNSHYINLKRPSLPGLRKRIQNKNKTIETTEQAMPEVTSPTILETTSQAIVEEKNETSTEKYTSETAIMKIAKDERKHPVTEETSDNPLVDQSQRVSDLTLAASKEYNTPGLFKSVSPNTRRVPNYFTIATDDPILPIEAFFPQLNQKKDT